MTIMSNLRHQLKNSLFNTVQSFSKFILGSACFMLVMASCSKNSGAPAGLLSQAEMVNALTEIYITEEKINRLALTRDSADVVFDFMAGRVFEKIETEDSIFRISYDYYMDHPKEMELIYTALVDSLQLKEQRVPFIQP